MCLLAESAPSDVVLFLPDLATIPESPVFDDILPRASSAVEDFEARPRRFAFALRGCALGIDATTDSILLRISSVSFLEVTLE